MVLLAVLAIPNLAMACSCVWAGPFAKVAPGRELVVYGEVLDYYGHSMEVKVLEVLKGKEERSTIRIWGDNGALCRPYVTSFPIGTRWLFAVSPLRETLADKQPASFWEGFFSRAGRKEYAISVCGDFWLAVRGEMAVGRITIEHHSQSQEWVPLKDIVVWIRSNGQAVKLSPTPLSPSDR
jgi:hypothetical protein